MKSSIRYCFVIVFLFLYIYSIKFTFLPLTGKQIVALAGASLFALNSICISKKYIINIFKSAIIVICWGFITSFLNFSGQFIYIQQIGISSLSCFFAAYFILTVAKDKIQTLSDLTNCIVIVVLLESLLTVFIRLSPEVYNVCTLIQEFQFDESHMEGGQELYRFFGVGNAIYFGVLPSCALGTGCCAYLMSISKGRKKYFYGIAFVIITVISFLVTRYSLIISTVSFCLYLWNTSFISIRNVVLMLFVAALLYVLFIIASTYLPDAIVQWAMSAFEKDGDNSSTGTVIEWWTETRIPISTLFWGDGMYTEGGHYYKRIDVGHFRQIYYSGVIGLLLVFRYYWRIIKSTVLLVHDKHLYRLLMILFANFIVSMAKGDLSMLDVFFLFFVYGEFYYNRKKEMLF